MTGPDRIEELHAELRSELAEAEAAREPQRFGPSFLDELRAERDRQRSGGPDQELADWALKLTALSGMAAELARAGDRGSFERLMVRVAALAAGAHRAQHAPATLAAAEQDTRRRARKLAERGIRWPQQ